MASSTGCERALGDANCALPRHIQTSRVPAIAAALLICGAVLAWWALTVRVNYGGNWTALYWSGEAFRTPPELAGEGIHRRPGTGFDGQFYHLLAHDPLLRYVTPYIDTPGLRARRILVPALAWLISGGKAVDPAYLAVILAFIFAGAYWLARIAGHWRWAFLFGLSGAFVAAVDNLTVDVALASLALGFVHFERNRGRVACAALAGLARETGVLLAAAGVLAALRQRRWREAALYACAALPFGVWTLYVRLVTPPYDFEPSWSAWVPFRGVWNAVFNPVKYPQYPEALSAIAIGLEYLALAGGVLAIVLAVRLARERFDPAGIAALLFAVLSIFVQQANVWLSVWGFARVFAPLYLLLAVNAITNRRPSHALPLLMMAPRCLVMLGPQAAGILRVGL